MTTQTTNTEIYTRSQYLNHECTHRQYYEQFVNASIYSMVKDAIKRRKVDIVAAIKEDEHINNVPLPFWDNLAGNLYDVNTKMKLAGDYLTLSGGVCIVKTAAKMIAEDIEKKV